MSQPNFAPLDCHQALWQQFSGLIAAKRLPQAVLLLGPEYARLERFADRLMALSLCQQQTACGRCEPCQWLLAGEHVDLHRLVPEEQDKAIKIDQVRAIQEKLFQAPKTGAYRFVLIAPANKLNPAAANALLKILEEPPEHVRFILLAEQLSQILPTILSRCQRYTWSPAAVAAESNAFSELYQAYSDPDLIESSRGQLLQRRPEFIKEWLQCYQKQISLTELSRRWSRFALRDLIWALGLFNAEQIAALSLGDPNSDWSLLFPYLDIYQAYRFQDALLRIGRPLEQAIPLNANLLVSSLILQLQPTPCGQVAGRSSGA